MKRFIISVLLYLAGLGMALAAVNLNTATVAELDAVKGIGQAKAQAIVDYRTKNGPFMTLDAAFWITAAACGVGHAIELPNVGWNPRRNALVSVLRRMGASITFTESLDDSACERLGTIRVEGRRLHGTEVGGAEIPDLIDELPLVAVAGALASGRTVIRDAAELRVKESDRIRSVVDNLSRMGVNVEERPDGMIIEGSARVKGGVVVDSYGDHRLPMAMSVLAMAADAPVRMDDIACVNKSYPEFWDDLRKVGGHAE